MASLDGPRQKLDWADKHLRILEKQMREQLDDKEYTVTRKAQTKVTEGGGMETRFQAVELLDPPDLPVEWALLIGDFASNARAALDHLAWQLALENTWTPSRHQPNGKPWPQWPPKDTEFPIWSYRPDPRDDKRLKRRLSYFRPLPRATVEGLQPYKRRKLAKAEPLWMLKALRDTDTHRTLHTVLAEVPAGIVGHFYKTVPTPEGGTTFDLPHQLKKFGHDRTRLDVSVGDVIEATLKITANFSPFVTFDQRGADFDGQEVLPLLRRCRNEVERILGLFPS